MNTFKYTINILKGHSNIFKYTMNTFKYMRFRV
jgi:hypothetical protein